VIRWLLQWKAETGAPINGIDHAWPTCLRPLGFHSAGIWSAMALGRSPYRFDVREAAEIDTIQRLPGPQAQQIRPGPASKQQSAPSRWHDFQRHHTLFPGRAKNSRLGALQASARPPAPGVSPGGRQCLLLWLEAAARKAPGLPEPNEIP